MNLESPLTYSHTILAPVIQSGDTVIDATVGNGHDTIFLASQVGRTGHVLGFDIQPQALAATKQQLVLTGLAPQTSLIFAGHESLNDYLDADQEISAATFNLGYLPGSDKTVTTTSTTTVPAIAACLQHLRSGGIVSVMVYYGHPAGKSEKQAVLDYMSGLDQAAFQVLQYQFINQVHEPPFLVAIQRR